MQTSRVRSSDRAAVVCDHRSAAVDDARSHVGTDAVEDDGARSLEKRGSLEQILKAGNAEVALATRRLRDERANDEVQKRRRGGRVECRDVRKRGRDAEPDGVERPCGRERALLAGVIAMFGCVLIRSRPRERQLPTDVPDELVAAMHGIAQALEHEPRRNGGVRACACGRM